MILAGASAIVTGGAVRIGREIGRQLAGQGANVCVHYGSSSSEANDAVEEYRRLGVRSCAVQGDLRHPVAAARDVFAQAGASLGIVRILINSAAIFEQGSLLTTDEENWERHLSINLKAPFYMIQEFARQLPENETGAVVNIVDWRGERPIPGHAAYTIAKAGLIAQTQLLAQELGPRIRVNAIAPGAILPAPGDSTAMFEARGRRNPLQRTGAPSDIARGVLYLLSSDFVTGEILHITGGEELGKGNSY
ncbi:SDR family oxidoreductase [Planctomicrobium sp. SH661]|uniref:SDR family oxidoreductase n=1 Tax=Planctomicrobium sp. SH661 TaxID=3448124 RepID=UPI003F5B822B